jgi:hypothetical protein
MDRDKLAFGPVRVPQARDRAELRKSLHERRRRLQP